MVGPVIKAEFNDIPDDEGAEALNTTRNLVDVLSGRSTAR